jgi:hypothetical protein
MKEVTISLKVDRITKNKVLFKNVDSPGLNVDSIYIDKKHFEGQDPPDEIKITVVA